MNLPKVTIIIPTYNVGELLSDALKSIVEQKYKNIEVIIVDAQSTDDTLTIIKNYSSKYSYIRYISEKDNGLYDAMNKGIDKSTGEWLYFMGADDSLYNSNVIKEIYNSGLFNQEKVIYGNVFIKGDNPWAKDGTIYDGAFSLKKLLSKNICQQAIFYPRHMVNRVGYFNNEYYVTADWDYNLRCFAHKDFIYIDLVIANFKSGGISSMQDNFERSFLQYAENVFKYFKIDVNADIYKHADSPFYNIIHHYNYIVKIQLNPFSKHINEGVSLFTAVKNRNELFEGSLKSWVRHKEIDEIIVVDWGSDQSLIPIINKYQNGKIYLAIVRDQKQWVLAPAFNLSARLTTKNKILKIDADVKLHKGFFDEHKLRKGLFYAGDWSKARDQNETHLNGNLYIYRDDFFKVNGYNEFFKTYGWDDSDLFKRLEDAGIERKCFNYDTMYHIEHQGRMEFQSPSKKLKNLNDEEWSRINIFFNRYIAEKMVKWSAQHNFMKFNIDIKDQNTIICEQSGADENKIPGDLILEAEIAAIKDRLVELRVNIPDEVLKQVNNNLLIDYFNAYLAKKNTNADTHLYDLFEAYNNTLLLIKKHSVKEIEALKSRIVSLKTTVKEKEEQVAEKNNELKQLNIALQSKDQIIDENVSMLQEKEELIKDKKEKINSQISLLENKDKEIQEINASYNRIKADNVSKEKNLMKQNKRIEGLENKLDLQSNRIMSINQRNIQLQKLVSTKEEIIKNKENAIRNHIVHIHRLIHQINEIYASYSWRFGNFIPKLLSTFRSKL